MPGRKGEEQYVKYCTFLDLLPQKGFVNKVILPVASGGTIAPLLALEYAFKPVFSVLGSREIINGVYIVDSDISSYKDQLTFAHKEIEQRLTTALNDLVNQLPKQVKVNE